MDFEVLGAVQARGTSGAAPGRGHRRTLLALLLAAGGRTVTTDALVDGLWPQEPPRTARRSLQSHVSRLRSDLAAVAGEQDGGDVVVSGAGGYCIDLTDHTLDAVRFADLVERAGEVWTSGPAGADDAHDRADRAAALLDTALGLWRGAAYGELADHEQLRAEVQRLEALRRTARAERTDAWLALGRFDRAVAAARRAIDGAPTDERAHAQLLRGLYAVGRQSEALAAYRGLRERLRDELGVDPSPEVQRLHRQVLQQDPELAAAARSPNRTATDATTAPSTRVPRVAIDLVGRDEDVAAVAERVAPGRLVTLTGPGGVGKTRVAEQVAARIADRFSDGTAVVELAAVRDPGAVGDALVTGLGIQPTGDASVRDTLVAALAQRNLLLVLDNCEHVLDAVAPLASALLGHCPEVALLATSRERLRLTGEQLWQVAPLEVPAAGADRQQVLATSAGALFALRAEQADTGFELDEGVAADVAELCRRLDGMPLAIELAAARARAMAPSELVGRLDQRFTLLAGGPRHEAGRHRTLQSVVAWSYELLEPAEALLFDRLSVFSGAAGIADVEQVCAGDGIATEEVPGLLGELVDKSMVVAERASGGVRHRLLDTMREFGARRLAATDEPDRWRRRHAAHHVALVEELGPAVRGPDEATAVRGLTAAFDDLRAAHSWLVAAGDVDGALRIPAALGTYLFYRLRDEVTTWARRAIDLPDAATHTAYPAALATAACGATVRTECARARDEAARVLAHDQSSGEARAMAQVALGAAALYEGQLDELAELAEVLDAAAADRDDDFRRAFAGVLRVLAHAYRGRQAAALAALEDLDAAADASGSPTMRAFSRYCRGEVLLDEDPDAAVAALEEAVELTADVDNALVAGVSMVSLASLRGRLGDTTGALRTFRDVVLHWRRLGDHTHQLTTLRNLVVLLADVAPERDAAVLHGAVTSTAETPSFGAEQERLRQAWSTLEEALGPETAAAAARRGRGLSPGAAGAIALQHIEEVLGR